MEIQNIFDVPVLYGMRTPLFKLNKYPKYKNRLVV